MQNSASWSQQGDQTQQPVLVGARFRYGIDQDIRQQRSVVGARLRFNPTQVQQPQAPSFFGYTTPMGLPIPMPRAPVDNHWVQEQYAPFRQLGTAQAQAFSQPMLAQQQEPLETARHQAPAHQYRAQEPDFYQPAVQVNPGWEQGFNVPIQGQLFNAPTQGQSFNAPTQGQSFDAPTQEHYFNAPTQGQIFNAPFQGQIFNASFQGQVFNAPTQGQVFNAPTQGQVFNAPTQEQSFDAPTQEHYFNAPTQGQIFNTPAQGQIFDQPLAQVNSGWELNFDIAAQGQVFDQCNTLVNPWQQPNFDMGSLPQSNSQPEGSQNLASSHYDGSNGYRVDAMEMGNLGQQIFDAPREVQGTPATSLSSLENVVDLTMGDEVVLAGPKPPCHLSERKRYLSSAVKEGSPGFPWFQSFLMANATHQRAHCAKYWPTNEAAYEDVKYACDKFASFVEARLEYMRWDSMADDPPLVLDEEGNFSLKTPGATKKAREEDEEQLKKKLLESKKHSFSFDNAARKRKRSSEQIAPAAKKQMQETRPAEVKEAKTVDELSNFSLKELKAYLKGEKRPVKGSKAELVERVRMYLGLPGQGPVPSPEAGSGSVSNEVEVDNDDDDDVDELAATMAEELGKEISGVEVNASEMETEAASASDYEDALRQLFPQGFREGSEGLEEAGIEASDEE